jgi:hypothetical protein
MHITVCEPIDKPVLLVIGKSATGFFREGEKGNDVKKIK